MTARRWNTSPTTSPALTGGDDRPEPNCAGNPHPFDQLIDHGATRSTRLALRIARDLCGNCELRDTCLPANRGERWAQAILDAPPLPTMLGLQNQARSRILRENRAPALRKLAEAGATVEDACDLFGIQRDTLLIWCKRNDQLDLYRALSGRKGWAA